MPPPRNFTHILLRGFTLLLLTFYPLALLKSQQTDSVLKALLLGRSDLPDYTPEKAEIVYGANRIAESTEEIAMRTLVIQREEILRNGYTTLCDVLRNVPGIRTSEPGHALLGESFLIRGLEGNLYCKILVNGVPISPSGAPGMPLGANLPVKQAERIEIIFGPATTVYGTDAVAGVINIVLPEIDRPLDAMANVAIGSGGTDEFHLSIGGKAGGQRAVFTYRIFGSAKRILDYPLHYPDSLFILDTTLTAVQSIPREGVLPRFTLFRHESRVLGISCGFRGISLMVERLYRRDHTFLGNHPQEVAGYAPSALTGESIDNIQLQFDKTLFNALWIHTNIAGLIYKMDLFSAYTGVAHPIATGNNFMYAASSDFLAEQLINLKLKRISVLAGGNFLRQSGGGFQNFLLNPFSEESLIEVNDSITVIPNTVNSTNKVGEYSLYEEFHRRNWGAFTQVSFKTQSLNLLAGIRYDKPDTLDAQFSPKIAANWRVMRKLRLRITGSRAFRVPGAYYLYNNYEFSQFPGEPKPSYKKIPANLQPEILLNAEAGFTWMPVEGLKIEGHFTRTQMKNRIFAVDEFVVDTLPYAAQIGRIVGFFNLNSRAVYHAAEMFASYSNDWLKAGASVQYNFGEEQIENRDTLDNFRSVPDLMAQCNVQLRVRNWFRVSGMVRYTGKFISWASLQGASTVMQETGGFWSADALIGKTIAKRLDVYIRVKNLTNAFTKGLTSGFIAQTRPEYMVQTGRMFFFGITFTLN